MTHAGTRKRLRISVILLAVFAFSLSTASSAGNWMPLPDGEIQRIAFGSCSNQYLQQPIWTTIAGVKPDLFLHLGDIIYGDAATPGLQRISPEVDVIEKMRVDYALLANKPSFVRLRENVPFMAVWDDHDFGQNDGGGEFVRKAESRDLLLDFLDVPANSERRLSPGLYESAIFGPRGRRVQVIMLDTRYFRDPLIRSDLTANEARAQGVVGFYAPNEDPNATLLGSEQWRWLESQLRKPAEVRLLASSIQVIAGNKGAEGWGNFPFELERLYALIDRTLASGIVILSGDVHFSELSMIEGVIKYPLYEFTSSPLRQFGVAMSGWERTRNPYRILPAFAKDNFGVVDIDWSTTPHPTIVLRLMTDDGTEVLAHELSLGDLQ